jgi:hypothetical protein
MDNALKALKQLDLNTGEIVMVNSFCTNVKQYFASLNILNASARVYGAVYLATDEALKLLESEV